MNRRKILALFLVLSLTGSAMAVQQQQLYKNTALEAEGAVGIQQHSVFVELILEEDDEENADIIEFGAVVGLVKKCKRVDNTFDNAVLWFNDQFLFGNKTNVSQNVTKNFTDNDTLGANPDENVSEDDLLDNNRDNNGTPDRDGFIRKEGMEQRWGGCWIPDGFILVVGDVQDEDCGTAIAALNGFNEEVFGVDEGRCDEESAQDPDCNQNADGFAPILTDGECPGDTAWPELVKNDIKADHDCGGCMFDYLGSFYVTDPNFHTWIIDAFEGQGGATQGRPLYAVHLQVDPYSPDRQGFPDEAIWAYREDGRLRAGMPYNESPDHPCHDQATIEDSEMYASDLNQSDPDGSTRVANTVECSIEYNFLAAIAFDHSDIGANVQNEWSEPVTGVNHGSNESTPAWAGNSHPHNPYACYDGRDANDATGHCEDGPAHDHQAEGGSKDAVNVNLLFAKKAPFFVHNNMYWDAYGAPPTVDDACSTGDRDSPAIQARTFHVCDVVADTGFHLHDGSQTTT